MIFFTFYSIYFVFYIDIEQYYMVKGPRSPLIPSGAAVLLGLLLIIFFSRSLALLTAFPWIGMKLDMTDYRGENPDYLWR